MNRSLPEKFRAIMIAEEGGRKVVSEREIGLADLPDHDVLVEVAFSSLNYKDGLAISGKGKIARRLPMVAGIDIAGTVIESRSPDWHPGDRVVVTGCGLSETEWGGYSRFQRLKAEWLTSLPKGFSLEEAMGIGTAGLTAALCIAALERFCLLENGDDVLVTGAAGGVGSFAVNLLAAKGYKVTACTGRPETHDYLASLGASTMIDRSSLQGPAGALQKERWKAAIDCVGGAILANVLAQLQYGGAVAACGLAGGHELHTTVFPHILRNVALIGVDSVMAPSDKKNAAWKLLAQHLDRSRLRNMTRVEPMSALPGLADLIVTGQIRGRVVIDVLR